MSLFNSVVQTLAIQTFSLLRQQLLNFSSGTALPALRALLNKDMIFVDDEKVTRVLDPLLKYMLMRAF
jgi:hypothetical protein